MSTPNSLFDLVPSIAGEVHTLDLNDLGRLIPDGWCIETGNGFYSACRGDDVRLPWRTSLRAALEDVRAHLAALRVNAQKSQEQARLEQQESF